MIGKIVSHYKIIGLAGKGGMGVVYKAEDINLERTVALKFLPATYSFDEDAKKRFINEARSASALDHPNICTIFEIGESDDGQLFIAMALYEGETLKQKISKEKIRANDAISITQQICAGLEKAHQNNIIHRDIKPANIFITNEGVVKILDFGIAKVKGHTRLTLMGATAGTLEYMSPEQARGEEIDYRTDIWSAGVILYEMLTGNLPFRGEYDQALIYSILNQPPDLNNIPKKLIPVLKKSIAKPAKDRYQNTREMKNDLDQLKNSGGLYTVSRPFFRKQSANRKRLLLAAVMIAILIISLYFFRTAVQNNKTDEPERKTIVVLPFKNLGPSEDNYFAEGIRDEISNKLSSLSELGVISRNSADKYAGSSKSSKEIGAELGVDYILEGTIRWAKTKNKESRIRIIPQLVRVSDDTNIWSDAFDRTIDDIFNVQNEIARNVVDKMGIKMLLGQSVMGPPPTTNLDAYDYYLKALKFHYGPSTGSNIKTCVKLYEQAIALDSNFAAAHAQVSIAYMGLFKWYWDRDSLNLEKASWHLQKAADLNPDIAEVHLARFFYYYWYTSDEDRVLAELQKVLEIQPNNAEAHFMISGVYWRRGNVRLSEDNDLKALALDPLNARYPWGIAIDYNLRRDYSKADHYFKQAVKISPNTSFLYAEMLMNHIDWKGNTKLARQISLNIKDDEYLEGFCNIFIYMDILDRNYEEALKKIKSSKKEYENSENKFIPNTQMLALIYRYTNQKDLSNKSFKASADRLENMLQNKPGDNRLRFALSISYAGLGEEDKAVNLLNRAFEADPSWTENRRNYVRSTYLAMIYTLTGNFKNALNQVEYLLSNPTGFSVNRLKLDPLYDPLRNHERYKEITKKFSTDR